MTTPEPHTPFAELVRRQVQAALVESLADTYAPGLREMIERYLSRPARFIRPRLLIAAARVYGGRRQAPGNKWPPQGEQERHRGMSGAGSETAANELEPEPAADSPVLRLAVATELLHVFALLHDDRVDTPCREGEFSSGSALLAGDLLFAEGYGLIAETVERSHLAPEILHRVRHVASRTVVGQAADVTFRRTHDDAPTPADLYHLYDLKTGLYTIAAPLQIGALAAGCDPGEMAALEAVALPLGRAFQMRDDLEDITLAGTRRDSVPPWELNLAVTYAAERARRGGGEQPQIHDDAAFLTELDVRELERFVTGRIDALMGEAYAAVEYLDLTAARRGDLIRELADVLTSLTFPPAQENTVGRGYGSQHERPSQSS